MNIRLIAVGIVMSSLLLSSSAIAQQRHIVDAVAMNRAVAAQSATDQQNRDVVLKALHQPQMLEVANRLGLNVTTAEAAVATLSGSELKQLADQARTANTQLAGGNNTVIISTTTLLLILIIVILVVQ